MCDKNRPETINIEGLQELVTQIVTSNLTTAYFVHLQSGLPEDECTKAVNNKYFDLLNIFKKATENVLKNQQRD